MKAYPRAFRAGITCCVLSVLVCAGGCIGDADYSAGVTEFQRASVTLTVAFQALLNNANVVEENHYIDGQTFEGKPINPDEVRKQDVITPDEIKLRTAAITALADYTMALASLASGKPARQIQDDADKASDSMKGLASDAAAAGARDFSSPVAAAVSAAGEVLALIEKRRGMADVKASLQKNDPAVQALFTLISNESTQLYKRQQSTLSDTGVLLFHDYNSTAGNSSTSVADRLQLSDRIKQYQQANVALACSDPSDAIKAFKDAHDALVKAILAPKADRKMTFSELEKSVRAFAAEVQPLAANIRTLVTTH